MCCLSVAVATSTLEYARALCVNETCCIAITCRVLGSHAGRSRSRRACCAEPLLAARALRARARGGAGAGGRGAGRGRGGGAASAGGRARAGGGGPAGGGRGREERGGDV